MIEFAERKIDVNGMSQHYLESGSGMPLILLHGGLVNARINWGNCFEILSKSFRVYAIDTRGHGKSTNPKALWSYTQFVEDLMVFIDKLNIEKPLICGWSDGAQTALEFSYRYPDCASGFIIGGAFYQMDDNYYNSLKVIGINKDTKQLDYEKLCQEKPELIEYIKGIHLNEKDLLNGIAKIFTDEKIYSDEQLSKIQEKVLIVLGDRDEYLSIEHAVNLHKRIEKSYLSIIPNAGHSLPLTHANQLCNLLVMFSNLVKE